MTPELTAALASLDAGDLPRLRKIVQASPAILHEKVTTLEEPYAGYFAGATLLHHVAGNPWRGKLPGNIVEIARFLLESGADVNAHCGGGPKQPDTGGGTVLELVTSGGKAAERGFSESLIDLFLEHGADVNYRDGAVMWTALYHVVECRLQRDVARLCHDRGGRIDLGYAAGLGLLDEVKGYFDAGGALKPGAYARYRPGKNRLADPTDTQILNEALFLACTNGRDQVALELLDRGAEINARVRISIFELTPLHGAAWTGWPGLCRLLLERGADPTIREEVHNGSAPGWALFLGRNEAVEVFRQHGDKMDLMDALELGLADRVAELWGDRDPDEAYGHGDRGVLLRAAAGQGHAHLVDWLLERGADPALANREGKKASDCAAEGGHAEVARRLRELEGKV